MHIWTFEQQTLGVRETVHRHGDDLLTAGWGLAGLRQALPAPGPEPLSAAELRRRAIHCNWNGIAFLHDRSGFWETVLAEPVPGREFHAQLCLPGWRHGHRLLLQLPDQFDLRQPRLLACAASGSRGVYGTQAVAAGWALRRGYAVVSTDKGCGSDWFDQDSGEAPGLDGRMCGHPESQLFHPQDRCSLPHAVLTPHAHSRENPERGWGAMLNQAIDFAWQWLEHCLRLPHATTRRTYAVGLSNGGAAVLQALPGATRIDGALAAAANVQVGGDSRAMFDYAAEAALWLPLAQAATRLQDAPGPQPRIAVEAAAERAQQLLQDLGRLASLALPVAAEQALEQLLANGWGLRTLAAARITTAFDFWRAALVTYAQALGRLAPDDNPLAHGFAVLDAGGPRAASASERALWWSDGAGIVPGAGVSIVWRGSAADLGETLQALHAGTHPCSAQVAQGIREIRCSAPPPALPLLLLHGADDGLIPAQFSAEPYVQQARQAGADIRYRCLEGCAHFDAFLGIAGYGESLRPLLPALYAGLDELVDRVELGRPWLTPE